MAVLLNTTETNIESIVGPHRDWTYNGMDCCITAEVLEVIKGQLDPTTGATYEFAKALQAPVLEMMLRGILVDEERRVTIADLMRKRIAQLERQLLRLVREGLEQEAPDFNWRSNPDLLWLFYDALQLPPILNEEGNPTCNKKAMAKLQRYPFAKPYCKHLLALRDAGKMLGVLVSPIDPDGRMRCTFSIAGTETGRFSSYISAFGRGQNLQNQDPEMRYVFIADPGKKLAYIDLEQAESRAVGAKIFSLFGDPTYLDACESEDLHTTVSKMVWSHIKTKEDAKELFHGSFSYRETSKRLGHGTSYLGQPPHMAAELAIPLPLVEAFHRKFLGEAFPGIRRWHLWVIEQLATKGYIVSLTGRKRYFLGRSDDDHTVGEAVAYDPQETVARLLNQGLFKLWLAARRKALNIELLLQVHDAVVLQYPEDKEDLILPQCLDIIKVPLQLTSPTGQQRTLIIPSEAKTGWCWGERDKRDESNNVYRFDPDGMHKWSGPGSDTRTRTFDPTVPVWKRRKRSYPPQAAAA